MHRTEAIVGDYLDDALSIGWNPASLQWRSNLPVMVLGGSGQKVHVSLYLKYNPYSYVNVYVAIDLEFSCSGGKIFVMTRSLSMDYPVMDGASMTNKALLQLLLQMVLPLKIQGDLQKVTYTNDLGQPACPPISVDKGSVYLF